jgi:HKD family nuclease
MTLNGKLVLQGLTANTHVDAIRQLFSLPDIQKVLMSVAFISESGVESIEPELMAHSAHVTVFAGIRNDATSYQGLARLYGLVSELYTVDTGTRTTIFHPKLYLARATKRARLIVGSANLTLAGLNNNIEAGLLLDLDLTDSNHKAMINEIEVCFEAASREHPLNVVKASKLADLDELRATGRLVDEICIPRRNNTLVNGDEERDPENRDDDRHTIPRMRLKTNPLRSGVLQPGKAPPAGDWLPAPSVKPTAAPATPISTVATSIVSEPTATIVTTDVPSGKSSPERDVDFLLGKPYRYNSYRGYSGEGVRARAKRLREQARAQGKTTYFTGVPCKYGHVEDRFVSSGKCRECNRLDCEQMNRLGLYR